MTLQELRNAVVEIDAAIKAMWPEAWAMMVLSERGHIQFSLNRRMHWPLTTFDIPHNAPDWGAQTDKGLATMREALVEIAAKRERGEL